METRGEGDGPATNGVGKTVELDKGGNCAKIVRTQEDQRGQGQRGTRIVSIRDFLSRNF